MPDLNEAREEAWRTWLGESMPGESGFRFAWDARGRYDEQRIAELEAELDEAYRVFLIHYRMPHEPTNGDLSSGEGVERYDEWMEGVYRHNRPMTERVIERAMEHELRALGQSEEVKP